MLYVQNSLNFTTQLTFCIKKVSGDDDNFDHNPDIAPYALSPE